MRIVSKSGREKKKRGKCHVRKRELVCFLFLAFFPFAMIQPAYSNRSLTTEFSCLKQKLLPLVVLCHERNQIIIQSCQEHVRGVEVDNIS